MLLKVQLQLFFATHGILKHRYTSDDVIVISFYIFGNK